MAKMSDLAGQPRLLQRSKSELRKVYPAPKRLMTIEGALAETLINGDLKCLWCGELVKDLSTHLRVTHNATFEEYREFFRLPDTYPTRSPAPLTGRPPPLLEDALAATIFDEKLLCLIDGRLVSQLGAYLKREHDLTKEQYIRQFNLPFAYPMVSPTLSELRSQLGQELIQHPHRAIAS